MTNDEKINLVDDLNNKKSDKKSIAKIIFSIIILGLVVVWFTASFMRNINSSKVDDHVEDRKINRLIDDLDVGTYSSTIPIYFYSVTNVDYDVLGNELTVNDSIEVTLQYSYDLTRNSFVDCRIYIILYSGLFEDEITENIDLNLNYLNHESYESFKFNIYQNYNVMVDGDIYYDLYSLDEDFSSTIDISEFYFFAYSFVEETFITINFDFPDLYREVNMVKGIYQLGLNNSFDYGYSTGYDEGYNDGYDEGSDYGEQVGYDNGLIDGQKDNINQNAFKTLFNAILNAPYNIFSGLLEFELLGVNLFSLFSFIFTTILILTIIKFFMK